MMLSFITGSILCVILSDVYINAKKINRADYDFTTIELIQKVGFKAEEHNVVTEDGYILTLHRIPGEPGSPPVFLQHGLLTSSFEWLLSGKENSLGFYLANKGYDVWMGNSRGNMYSRRHVEYDPSEFRFWNFSWHEMGIYDVPAVIDYITKIKNESLLYIGHSMGTTMFFVMASEKPEIATKVKAMVALSPVVFLDRSISIFKHLLPIADLLNMVLQSFHIYEVLPPDLKRLLQNFVEERCAKDEEDINFDNVCAKLVHLVVGYNPSRLNYSVLPMLHYNFPRGSSVKTVTHFFQITKSGRFRQFDYGKVENLKMYNNYEPPEYNFSRIQVPIGLIWSRFDYFTHHPLDIARIFKMIPKKIFNYEIPSDIEFGHGDFLASMDAAKYVHSVLVCAIDKYRCTNVSSNGVQ